MNNIYELFKELYELQRLAHEGVSVDDTKVDILMQSLKDIHDKNIDSNLFLDDKQNSRRKKLYSNAVAEVSKYCKQVLKDEVEIRKRLKEGKF